MKKILINKILINIKNYYNYDDIKISELKYGLETLYLTLTKMLVILILAYFLKVIVPLILLLIFYGLLRLTGYGLHAKKSWQCWISSILIFLGIPFLCMLQVFPDIIKAILSLIGVILIIIYAPADTEKRPLINRKKRNICKYLTSIVAITYAVISYVTTNNLLSNALFYSIYIQVFMILPISYKIFNVKYNNYKNYIGKNLLKMV